MQSRFRTSSMTDDDVHRNLSFLRRRYSSHADDSVTTVGVLSVLSGECTRLGTTPHTSSMSVSLSMDTPPTHLLASSSSDRTHTVSTIRLSSISPVTPDRPDVSHSPYSSGNLTAAIPGLCVASVTSDSVRAAELNELRAQLWVELLHDLRLELQSRPSPTQQTNTSDSEDLLRCAKEVTCVTVMLRELKSCNKNKL